MSNRQPDSSYAKLTTALEFWRDQTLKEVNTSMPGLIVEYDSATKRAKVQPAVLLVTTDLKEHVRPPIVDVPVLHPSGGGYVVHLPLKKDDPVMLLFSERGISQFKETYRVSAPDDGAVLSMRDAVAIPGFGAQEIAPATDGLCAQTEDGADYFSIKPGDITVKSTGTVTLRGASHVLTVT